MKKFLIVLLTFCVFVGAIVTVTGCSNDQSDEIKAKDLKVVTTKCVVQPNKDYKESVKSFYDKNYNYWVFEMGLIVDVPLEETYSYIKYNGGNLKREVTTTKTSASSIKNVSEQSATNFTSWSDSHSVNIGGNISFGIKNKAEINIAAGYNYVHTNSGSNSDAWSKTFEECESYSETEVKTTTLAFDENCEKGYYRYVYIGVVKVYVAIIQDRSTGKYYNDTYTEIKAYGYCLDFNADSPIFDICDTNKLDFDLSLIEELPEPVVKLPVDVVPTGIINVNLTRTSCKLNNGYDISVKGTEKDILAHSKFDLLELVLENTVKDADGKYYVPKGQQPKLYLKILQNPNKLPVGSQLGSVNWTIHYVNNNTYNNAVLGTNIASKIGKGAYYVKVNYTDGSFNEFNEVNILNGKAKDNLLSLNIDFNSNKKLKSVEVVCVYQLYYDYMAHVFNWGGTKCRADWRCSTTLNFN